MTNVKPFSDQLRELRSKLNFSQEQLAARLNVSFQTVNRWEGGKVAPQKAQLEAVEKLMEEAGIHNDGEDNTADGGTNAVQPRRRRGVTKSTVLGNRGMEQMLWDAACSIRGEKDAPKFKDYLLPLLFIKRLSDVFDDETQRLADQFGDRDTALEVLENDHKLVRFYIPPEARWPVVSGREPFKWPKDKAPKGLGEQLTTTIRAIVKHNPSLAGVIDIVDFNETRNGEREISDSALKGIVETFSDTRYRLGLHDVKPDFLGDCYEYLLRKFAEGQGQSAGEFFTPMEVGFLMAEIMRPRAGEECYDYACGSFGLLVKLQIVSRRLDPLSKVPLKLYGQELTGSSYAIACMNKIIHDMEGEVARGDSMRNPKFKNGDARLKNFDVVVANPMWNQAFDADVFENDPFERFEEQGGVTGGKGDWAWLQHTLAALKDSGRAAIVLDTGAMTRGSGSKNEDKERTIRKWFVEHDLVDGVILLPDNLFYNTTAAGIIVVLRKNKPKDRKGKIILVNATQEFRKGTPKNYIPETNLKHIIDGFLAGKQVDNFVAVISQTDAAAKDYNLLPAAYIGSSQIISHREVPIVLTHLEELDKQLHPILLATKKIVSSMLTTSISSKEQQSWDEKLFPDFIELHRGYDLPIQDRKSGNVPVVGSNGIVGYHSEAKFQGPGVMTGRSGTIGKSYFMEGPHWPLNTSLYVSDFKGNDPLFVHFFLQQFDFTFFASGVSVPTLNRNALNHCKVRIPKLETQKTIASILQTFDSATKLTDQKAHGLNELFKALLQKLISGQLGTDNLIVDQSKIRS